MLTFFPAGIVNCPLESRGIDKLFNLMRLIALLVFTIEAVYLRVSATPAPMVSEIIDVF